MDCLGCRDFGDDLHEWLGRLLHDFCEGGREDRFGEGCLGGGDLGAEFAHGHGDAVFVAFFVRHEICEVGGVGGVVAVPDVVEEAVAGFEGAVFAGDEVSVL